MKQFLRHSGAGVDNRRRLINPTCQWKSINWFDLYFCRLLHLCRLHWDIIFHFILFVIFGSSTSDKISIFIKKHRRNGIKIKLDLTNTWREGVT